MKTIICDMSGIVSDKGKSNEKLLNVFQNLKKFNYAFCTGKGYLGSCETLNQTMLPLPIICENGALLIDRDNKAGVIIAGEVKELNFDKPLTKTQVKNMIKKEVSGE